jgi:hypothetical protein
MADLDMLANILRSGAQGKADLAGLDEDYARANAMRDNKGPQANQYGTVSPMSVMANVINQSRGRKQARELAPQRAAARQSVAESANAFPLHNARQSQENFDATELNKLNAAKGLARAKLAKRTISDRINPDTGAVERVETDENGNLYREGVNVGDSSQWVKAPTKSNTTNTPGGGYVDKAANARAETGIKTLGRLNSALGYVAKLDEKTTTRLNSTKERLIKFGTGMLPSELKQLVQGERESDPQVKKYFSYLSGLSGEQRNELFGSALTEVEKMSSDEFLAGVMTLTLDDQTSRLRNGVKDGVEAITIMDRIHGGPKGSRYTDSLGAMDFGNLAEPSPSVNTAPPAALDMLAKNPSMIEEFKAKYGYTPEGM